MASVSEILENNFQESVTPENESISLSLGLLLFIPAHLPIF
jgi:hypothetical protein